MRERERLRKIYIEKQQKEIGIFKDILRNLYDERFLTDAVVLKLYNDVKYEFANFRREQGVDLRTYFTNLETAPPQSQGRDKSTL